MVWIFRKALVQIGAGASLGALIAFAIDADSGFVAVHHIVRIVFVMISVPLLAAWVARSRGEQIR